MLLVAWLPEHVEHEEMSDGGRLPWLLIERKMGFDTQHIVQRLLASMSKEQGATL